MWNGFPFREDDICIASYAKSGTTWLQQIVAQLIFSGADDIPVADMSPWIDLRVPTKEEKFAQIEAQTHRRFVKTHLPVDALVFSPCMKYLYIARDGRDVVWSMHNHQASGNEAYYSLLNDTPDRIGPPIESPTKDVRQYFLDWLEKNGHPWWPFWENVKTWWDIRNLPNVQLLHYHDLKTDLPKSIHQVAKFLEIQIDPTSWDSILLHCSFDHMKSHGTKIVPLNGTLWSGGAQTFMHKGTNGRWRDILTAEDISSYETTATRELGPECATWLNRG
ncbi:MAG: sulfotransferase domain-containing protein [Patescibacteria group bacterium]